MCLLPQALRIALPALLGFAIAPIFQGTSLCFTIALPELVVMPMKLGPIPFATCLRCCWPVCSMQPSLHPGGMDRLPVEKRSSAYAANVRTMCNNKGSHMNNGIIHKGLIGFAIFVGAVGLYCTDYKPARIQNHYARYADGCHRHYLCAAFLHG